MIKVPFSTKAKYIINTTFKFCRTLLIVGRSLSLTEVVQTAFFLCMALESKYFWKLVIYVCISEEKVPETSLRILIRFCGIWTASLWLCTLSIEFTVGQILRTTVGISFFSFIFPALSFYLQPILNIIHKYVWITNLTTLIYGNTFTLEMAVIIIWFITTLSFKSTVWILVEFIRDILCK